MLQLTRIEGGGFDLVADTSQDDASAENAAASTVVYAALYTDAKAPTDVVADTFAARGWWADPTAGTGLWYVRWRALDDKARAEAIRMVEQALARAPALANVAVAVDQTASETDAGNVSQVLLEVTGQHNGRAFLVSISL